MTKRQAGIWESKLCASGFSAWRCEHSDGSWSVWCQEALEHFSEAVDVRYFMQHSFPEF